MSPEAAALVCAVEKAAGVSWLFVLTASRTRRAGAFSRMQTVAVVGVTLPHQAPLTNGEAVCAISARPPTRTATVQNRIGRKKREDTTEIKLPDTPAGASAKAAWFSRDEKM